MFERSQSSFVVCGKFWGGRREKVKVSPDTALGQEGNRARGGSLGNRTWRPRNPFCLLRPARQYENVKKSGSIYDDYERDGEKGQQQPALVSLPRPSQQ
jgi:hypothetical protein